MFRRTHTSVEKALDKQIDLFLKGDKAMDEIHIHPEDLELIGYDENTNGNKYYFTAKCVPSSGLERGEFKIISHYNAH